MQIQKIITALELLAPPSIKEDYDNIGLIVGNVNWECTGVICTLDALENVVDEAIQKKANLIVAHHPILFVGLKKITGKDYVEKTIIKAIKNDIAIYAIHTNLDNINTGVNARMAKALGLVNTSILLPKAGLLKKLYTYIPVDDTPQLQEALFAIGAGQIGNYSECSFTTIGEGTFTGNKESNPTIGNKNERTTIMESKVEFIFPAWLQHKVIATLKANHPYEEVAYEIITLDNENQEIGSGMVGYLPKPMTEKVFFSFLKKQFNLNVIRHTTLLKKKINKVALCGGSGSFLISNALAAQADVFITADVKYHEFFNANNQLVIADIGHWETEQFTIDLIFDYLSQKFPNFAVLKTRVKTNSICYFV
jgi:dinuclear metal center YbgI/SA1388 family protein